MTDLLDLAARLDAAREPCRDLDSEIAAALGRDGEPTPAYTDSPVHALAVVPTPVRTSDKFIALFRDPEVMTDPRLAIRICAYGIRARAKEAAP